VTKFSFYLGDDQDVVERLRRATASIWGEVKEVSAGSFWLFIPSGDYERSFGESCQAVGAVAGYVRHNNLEHIASGGESFDTHHNRRFIAEIVKDGRWPLGSQWTGSFAAVAHSRGSREVILCNDPIGNAPVYFSRCGEGILGGTSLIVLSHCIRCEVDAVGILQRITTPYCNYGRRTLLKQMSRLLPGEWLKLSNKDSGFNSIFDNSLCNGLVNADVETVARTVWDCLQREIVLATGVNDRIGVAMSGGWDSRLILGGIAHRGSAIDCYTYGSEDLYESSVAKRCASAVGARHQCFSLENKYFPSRNNLENLVRETETANYMEWYPILDAVAGNGEGKPILLLGDLCESIDGRYMENLSSRAARKRSFANSFLRRPDQIAVATVANFDQWKEKKRKQIIEDVIKNTDNLSPTLASMCTENLIAQEVANDLELSFMRVRQNMPAFEPMFDELFLWFHRIRFLLGSQIPFLASAFRPLSPAMSVRFLRLISTVHPRLRMRRRLMDAMTRLPEFDILAGIPSAQIPWLSARSPTLLRELLWGVRSGLDQVMIKSVMKSKNIRRRQRVLRSINYINEYRRDNVVPTVQEWFSGKWVKSDSYIQVAGNRANLSAWPLIGVDISAPANVSIILDLCQID